MIKLVLDGREEHYHIRELDNRVRIVLSQPGHACQTNYDFWYIPVQDLVDSKWVHREGSAEHHRDRTYKNIRQRADALAEELIAKSKQGVPTPVKKEDTGPTRPVSIDYSRSIWHNAPEGLFGENE